MDMSFEISIPLKLSKSNLGTTVRAQAAVLHKQQYSLMLPVCNFSSCFMLEHLKFMHRMQNWSERKYKS